MKKEEKHLTAPDFRPLYIQVKEMVLAQMANNEFKPGDLLPSEPRLADMFGVSPGTVRKALDELTLQNLLVRRQGKGTYVATHTVDRALFHFFHLVGDNGQRSLPDSRVIALSKKHATVMERQKLQLGKTEQVIRIIRIRTLEDAPIIHEKVSLPCAHFAGLEKHDRRDLPNTLYRYYEANFQLAVVSAIEKVKAVAATGGDVKHLGVELGTPLLEIDRVAIGHQEALLEWRVSRCNTKDHHYLNNLD